MLDEGTKSRSASEIAMAVESMGATIDASCGWDGVYVSFRCLAANLGSVLDLTFDILLNPTFPKSEWERVRGQTLASLLAERDSAESRAYRGLLSSIYAEDHPYRFPLVGHEATVTGLTSDDLAMFHARFMLASEATIVVAGDVEPSELAKELNARLSAWGPATAAVRTPLAPSRRPGRRLILFDRPGAPQAVVRAGHLGIARSDADFEPIVVLNQILGGQFSSRLNAKLREERGFTYGVRSHFDCRRQPGPFSITASLQANRLGEALDDIFHELEGLTGGRPPSQIELDHARRALIEGQARHYETPSALVSRCASLIIHGLPVDHEAGFADRLAAIDVDSLTAQARERIDPGSLVSIVVADAELVVEELKRLEWASLERIDG
jgi:predicted Zn-dependent peptidase